MAARNVSGRLRRSSDAPSSTSHRTGWSSAVKGSFAISSSTRRIATRSPRRKPRPASQRLFQTEILTLNQWNDSVEQWIARVNFLAAALPEHDDPKDWLRRTRIRRPSRMRGRHKLPRNQGSTDSEPRPITSFPGASAARRQACSGTPRTPRRTPRQDHIRRPDSPPIPQRADSGPLWCR